MDTSRQQDQSRRVGIPYYPGLSHKIRRCLQQGWSRDAFNKTCTRTLRSVLSKKKPQSIEQLGIPCYDLNWSSIDETDRILRQREKRDCCFCSLFIFYPLFFLSTLLQFLLSVYFPSHFFFSPPFCRRSLSLVCVFLRLLLLLLPSGVCVCVFVYGTCVCVCQL